MIVDIGHNYGNDNIALLLAGLILHNKYIDNNAWRVSSAGSRQLVQVRGSGQVAFVKSAFKLKM